MNKNRSQVQGKGIKLQIIRENKILRERNKKTKHIKRIHASESKTTL